MSPLICIAALYRYPVKSMRGESLSEAKIWYTGLEGDRRYAFLRLKSHSRFPWLTGREVPEMLQYRPEFDDPTQPASSTLAVRSPDGNILPVTSEDLRADLEQRAGEPAHLLHLGKGAHDSITLSIMSTSTLRTLSGLVGFPLVAERFRPNILVDTGDAEGFPEDDWVGKTLVFGDRPDAVRVHVVRPIVRCMMINLDPETTHQTQQCYVWW
ncbi:MAG: MOSC domain-containing protein [Anaerolineae bacterium]|nr:MOSC domain-containing protein [Anaerolineae bacterium]